MQFEYLVITYTDKNLKDDLMVKYRLRDTPIAKKWTQRVLLAQQHGYSIDDPGRFYGFGSLEQQTESALKDINSTIDHINRWYSIDYRLQLVHDQDTLNRLHHVFEIEHGLLDSKDFDSDYKKHLCNLNLQVHRCESVARGANPRHVITYFGLPKTETLDDNDYEYFEPTITFGTVYINYAEIGKTLFDLAMDNDSYIEPAAFQPFCHYSADFVVRFWNNKNCNLHDQLYQYYNQHQEFFESLGYTWSNLSRSIGSIPVADLDYSGDILKDLETRQFVKAVHFL